MKKHTPSGRASICNWDLSFSFLTKEQCVKFIEKWLKEDYYGTDISYREEFNGDKVIYYIQLDNMYWGSNLKRVAKILEKLDPEC